MRISSHPQPDGGRVPVARQEDQGGDEAGRTRRGAGTAGCGGAPAAAAPPSPSRTAPRRPPGTARRAGRSRGSSSRSLPECESSAKPDRRAPRRTLRRRSAPAARSRCTAAEVNSPRKRRSPTTRAGRVERLHADVVEVGWPVHGRARVRLGQHEHPALARLGARTCAGAGSKLSLAPRPSARRMPSPLPVTAARTSSPPRLRERVLAVAEEGEVLVRQPAQQPPRLGGLVRQPVGRPLAQLVGDRPGGPPHLRPVLDRGADVVEHAGAATTSSAATSASSVSRSISTCIHDSTHGVVGGRSRLVPRSARRRRRRSRGRGPRGGRR